MSTVSPISARNSGEACRLLEEQGVGDEMYQRTMVQRPNEAAGLLKGLDAHTAVMADVVSILAANTELFAAKVAEAKAELAARQKYGDHSLAKRGQTIPREMPLTALKPVGFYPEGDGSTLLQTQELDESESCFAPWGLDLVQRIYDNEDGEGEAFLATLDQAKYYYFTGDKNMHFPNGEAVMRFLGCKEGQWYWFYVYQDFEHWHAHGRHRVLPLSHP